MCFQIPHSDHSITYNTNCNPAASLYEMRILEKIINNDWSTKCKMIIILFEP